MINFHRLEIEGKKQTTSRVQPWAPQFDASSDPSGLVLPASCALVKWLSSRTSEQEPGPVAFAVSRMLQTSPCTLYASKQQRPIAWITAQPVHL